MTEKKGYTLIELLIAIALFSILLSIAIPNFNFYTNLREKQEIAEFKKDLLFARNSAIVENRYYIVYFNHSENSYIIKTGEASPTIKSKTFGQGLKLDIDNLVGSFTFTPSGATGNSNTLYINARKNRRYVVTLTPATGRIEIKFEK
ncbi:MAG: type II secretion system protein [Tissierella sp.]|nr:type II secretion system protein [Tissierella sp.]